MHGGVRRLRVVKSYVSNIAPTIEKPQVGAASLQAFAADLNTQGISSARGQGVWSAVQVQRILQRISARLQKFLTRVGRERTDLPFFPDHLVRSPARSPQF
jgi:hypothetical protein